MKKEEKENEILQLRYDCDWSINKLDWTGTQKKAKDSNAELI